MQFIFIIYGAECVAQVKRLYNITFMFDWFSLKMSRKSATGLVFRFHFFDGGDLVIFPKTNG